MREILFKAKRLDNGKWVEGYYYSYETLECFEKGDKYHCILKPGFADWSMPRPAELYEIDPNTLCQFTGLTDKDGNKIWENDIVDISDCWWASTDITRHLVEWNETLTGFSPFVDYDSDCCIYYYSEDSKVIGNKFDNFELLERNF